MRYLSSFIITLLCYMGLIAAIIYLPPAKKPVVLKTEKVLALNHVSLIQQKEVIKKVKTKEIKKPKEIKKLEKPKKEKKKKKLAVKKKIQKIKEVKTVSNKIKESKKVIKKEKVVEKYDVEEKKEPLKEAQPKLQKTAVKRDYKEEFLQEHLQQIITLIQKKMKYPRRAKMLKIQGEVFVEFTITKSGEIKDLKPIKGHRLLQKSTLKAIRQASKLFPKVKKNLTLIVPVSYTLT